MKHFSMIMIGFLCFFTKNMVAQTTQGSIQNTAQANSVLVVGKPSSTLTNVRFSSFSVSVSIPHQTVPPTATITLNGLPHLNWSQVTESNFDGRDYFIFLGILDVNNNTTVTWPAGQSNPILKIQFNGGTGSQIVQLDDLTGQNGGQSQQIYWYVELLGTGDITDYNAPFYASPGSGAAVNNPGGNSNVPTLGVVALPLQLTSFRAAKLGGQAVRCLWSTENEAGFSHFELEKSAEGTSWSAIGSAAAKGQPEGRADYFFDDGKPFGGINYYRLKMIDNDGLASFSTVREVNFEEFAQFQVFPNPASSGFWLRLPGQFSGEKITLRMFDLTGRLAFDGALDLEANNPTTWINLEGMGLKSGGFLLEIRDENGVLQRVPLVLQTGF